MLLQQNNNNNNKRCDCNVGPLQSTSTALLLNAEERSLFNSVVVACVAFFVGSFSSLFLLLAWGAENALKSLVAHRKKRLLHTRTHTLAHPQPFSCCVCVGELLLQIFVVAIACNAPFLRLAFVVITAELIFLNFNFFYFGTKRI